MTEAGGEAVTGTAIHIVAKQIPSTVKESGSRSFQKDPLTVGGCQPWSCFREWRLSSRPVINTGPVMQCCDETRWVFRYPCANAYPTVGPHAVLSTMGVRHLQQGSRSLRERNVLYLGCIRGASLISRSQSYGEWWLLQHSSDLQQCDLGDGHLCWNLI